MASSYRTRRAIHEQWRRVPMKTRFEVLRLAKQGKPHPDVVTDTAAVQYCRVVLEQPSFLHTVAFQLVLSLAVLGIALVTDDAFPRWCAGIGGGLCLLLTIYNWDQKRDARKVLAVPRDAPLPEAQHGQM